MNIETLVTFGHYAATFGFFVATTVALMAARKFGKSALGSVFNYLVLGTGTFFVIAVFQTLGGDFFGISDESMDIWWHVMFYTAFLMYFLSFKALVGLASGDSMEQGALGKENIWGVFVALVLLVAFLGARSLDPIIQIYETSHLSTLGLHHFLAFLLAGFVGTYLFSIRKNIGQIGRAVAMPMLITVYAFCFQHFWELLFESWGVVVISSENGEGIEKIFLTTAAICVIIAALRLKAFASPKSASSTISTS